jgi:hypothetical protein
MWDRIEDYMDLHWDGLSQVVILMVALLIIWLSVAFTLGVHFVK